MQNFIPKGKAWEGANTLRLVKFLNEFWIAIAGVNTFRYKRNQFIDSAEKSAVDDYFNDINYNPRIFSSEIDNKLDVLRLYSQKKRWITESDWMEIANKLGFEVTIIRGEEVFDNPDLVSPEPPPATEKASRYILYIRVKGINEDGFPYSLPFTFGGGASSANLIDLYRSILDVNIEMRIF